MMSNDVVFSDVPSIRFISSDVPCLVLNAVALKVESGTAPVSTRRAAEEGR